MSIKQLIQTLKFLSGTRYLVRRLQTKFIISATRGKKFQTVLDIGAGKSPYRKFIKTEKYLMLDVEDRLGSGEVIVGDLNKTIPVADSSVDIVFCIEVLEHIKNPQNALTEVRRILKPGGQLILTTPMFWPEHEIPNDFYRYTQYGIGYLLKQVGLEPQYLDLSNGYWYSLCQLLVIKLKNPIWRPVVLAVNLLGLVAYRFERKMDLPLGIQVVAIKTQ